MIYIFIFYFVPLIIHLLAFIFVKPDDYIFKCAFIPVVNLLGLFVMFFVFFKEITNDIR